MTNDILARIDDTLEDWERGPDAARWAGEPREGEWDEDPDPYIDLEVWQQAAERLTETWAETRAEVMRFAARNLEEQFAGYRQRFVLGFDGSREGTVTHGIVDETHVWHLPQPRPTRFRNWLGDIDPALARAIADASLERVQHAGMIRASCHDQPEPLVIRHWEGSADEAADRVARLASRADQRARRGGPHHRDRQ